MFQIHFFSSMTSNILRSIYLQKIFLIYTKSSEKLKLLLSVHKRGIMVLILRLTASTIQRTLSLKTANKMKEILFELNKTNEGYHQKSSSKLIKENSKKSKTIKNQMNMKGSEDKPCGYIY